MVKSGRDANLDAEANQWLRKGVGKNERSLDRDREKLGYEFGIFSVDELKHYDPTNDWDSRDAPSMALVAGDIDYVVPTEIPDVEFNIRHRDQAADKTRSMATATAYATWAADPAGRRESMTHVGDDASWGRRAEEVPVLGMLPVDERKTCTRCKQPKGRECFSPDMRNRDKLQAWCKVCRKRATSQKRQNSRSAE